MPVGRPVSIPKLTGDLRRCGADIRTVPLAAALTVAAIPGLLGSEVADAEGSVHAGLPWLGCSVLVASSAALRTMRAKAASRTDTFVADVPTAAQNTRLYSEFIAAVAKAQTEDMDYCAVSIVGPRNRVDKIVGKLPLMP